jgi:thiol-disulfide isomerase/thioredoxin
VNSPGVVPVVDPLVLRVTTLIAVLLLASGVGLLLRRRAGRARAVTGGIRLDSAVLAVPLGERATFVQFSSPACSPCRSVRRVLSDHVAANPDLVHVDIDATERLDLARQLGILRTPTVLLLDADGVVVRRISGPITPEQARAAVPEPTRSR